MVQFPKKLSRIRSFPLCRLNSYLGPKALNIKGFQDNITRKFAMVAQGYEEAISALNGLQSNAATIQNIRLHGDSSRTQLPDTIKYLGRAGVSLDALDKLSVIHVTGTKGKGSTCAFTEEILRQYGYKTGLYTSPHLVSVTERIRINGQPIHRDEYTKHFWRVYNALYCKRESSNDMPAYFKFLTVLALKIFLEEQVDVAVLEVGIGGEYDCTNVVRRPVVCGITTLDLDHTSLLGHTLESIAWHKAGIIKPGAGVYTVQGHQPAALTIIEERAAQKQCKVLVCPALTQYSSGVPVQLGLAGHVQQGNASLALQLARYWINNSKPRDSHSGGMPPAPAPKGDDRSTPAFVLTDQEIRALRDVVWPGRSQVFPVDEKFTFFLDGAHTNQSMEACAQWFLHASAARLPAHQRARCVRVLWFNTTGDRDIQTLLRRLLCCRFNLALFTTNTVSQDPKFADQVNRTVSGRSVLLRCQTHLETWQYLIAARGAPHAEQSHHDEERGERRREELFENRTRQHSSRSFTTDQEKGCQVQTDSTNASSPICFDRSSLDWACTEEDTLEQCIVKSMGSNGTSPVRQCRNQSESPSENLSGRHSIAYPHKSMKSEQSGCTAGNVQRRENSLQASALLNSEFSSKSMRNDSNLVAKTSPKRRSNVLQENMAPREISGKEDFSVRACAKESKRDLEHDFDRIAQKSRQNEVPVSNVDSAKEHVSGESKSVARHASRSVSLPTDSGNRCVSKHTQSVSLDRTHMLQLVCADDFEDSASSAAVVIPYIQDALQWLRSGRHYARQFSEDREKYLYKLAEDSSLQETLAEADQVHVLVTGSLHLVGGVLAALDPSFTDSVPQNRPNRKRVLYSTPGTP